MASDDAVTQRFCTERHNSIEKELSEFKRDVKADLLDIKHMLNGGGYGTRLAKLETSFKVVGVLIVAAVGAIAKQVFLP